MSRLTCLPIPQYDFTGGAAIVTSWFGPRGGGVHYGVDFGTTDGIEVGVAVCAPVDGAVVHYQYDGPYTPSGGHTAGHNIWFQGTDGSRWKCFHLQGEPVVPLDVWVLAGTQIACVGNSGTQAAHLHLENHAGSWSHAVDFNADVQDAINGGRWPGASTPDHPPPEEAPVANGDWCKIANDDWNDAIYAVWFAESQRYPDGAPVAAQWLRTPMQVDVLKATFNAEDMGDQGPLIASLPKVTSVDILHQTT